jgi:hypothetical protein
MSPLGTEKLLIALKQARRVIVKLTVAPANDNDILQGKSAFKGFRMETVD